MPLVTAVLVSTHTGVPVAQSVVPTSQTLAGAQGAPVTQTTQLPSSQTLLVAHAVPLATAVPVSLQPSSPGAQEVAPTWQGFVGVQTPPSAAQGVQVPPLLQTSPSLQRVPGGSAVSVSIQAIPEAQDSMPTSQRLAGAQLAPSTQEMQNPLSQNLPLSQTVPLLATAVVATQVWTPLEHAVTPTKHRPVGVQANPGVQAPASLAELNEPLVATLLPDPDEPLLLATLLADPDEPLVLATLPDEPLPLAPLLLEPGEPLIAVLIEPPSGETTSPSPEPLEVDVPEPQPTSTTPRMTMSARA